MKLRRCVDGGDMEIDWGRLGHIWGLGHTWENGVGGLMSVSSCAFTCVHNTSSFSAHGTYVSR